MKPSTPSSSSPSGRRVLLVAVIVLALGAGSFALRHHFNPSAGPHGSHDAHATHAHEHDPAPAAAAAVAQRPPAGWPTDEPLRVGMQRIRTAAEPVLAAQARGELTAAGAKALTATINEQFAYMAQHCKLSPEADAALHTVVVNLLQASAGLEQDPRSAEAAHALAAALESYRTSFDHAGWSPLSLH